MTDTLRNTLKITTAISVIFFLASLYFLLYNKELRQDRDGLLFNMLLVVFTAIASIIQALVLYFLSQKED